MVALFISGTHGGRSIDVNSADWIVYGENSFDWFGSALDLVVTTKVRQPHVRSYSTSSIISQGRVLLVGANSAKNSKALQQAGKLYAFLMNSNQGTLLWTIEGVDEFAKLGSSVGHANPYGYSLPGGPTGYFLVAGPTTTNNLPPFGIPYYRAGAVYLVPFEKMRAGKLSNTVELMITNLSARIKLHCSFPVVLLSDVSSQRTIC